MTGRLIVALDTGDAGQARGLARDLAPHCALVKLGLEFFAANGPAGVRGIGGPPVFLDLKLHDIPNTVAATVRALRPLRVAMLTLHGTGGGAMIEAARRAADGPDAPKLLAVTVLTSLDEPALAAMGVAGTVRAQVRRLAQSAMMAGADGLVCSAHEVAMLRDEFGERPLLVVPGIRPAGVPCDDQARVMTPRQAIAAGADYLVVGRPITGAPEPARAAAAIVAEMSCASKSAA